MGVGGRGCGCGCVEASPTQAVYVVVTCTGAVYVRPERLGVGHASKTAVTKKFVMEGVDTESIDTGSVDAENADTESVATESGNTESALAQSVRVEALSQMSR